MVSAVDLAIGQIHEPQQMFYVLMKILVKLRKGLGLLFFRPVKLVGLFSTGNPILIILQHLNSGCVARGRHAAKLHCHSHLDPFSSGRLRHFFGGVICAPRNLYLVDFILLI